MLNLKEYLTDNTLFRLENVRFDIDDRDDLEESKITLKDTVGVRTIEGNALDLSVTREVNAEGMFNISVTYDVLRFAEDGGKEIDIEGSEDDIMSQIMEDIDFYIGYTMNKTSCLISSITSSYGLDPLITPPVFVEEDGE